MLKKYLSLPFTCTIVLLINPAGVTDASRSISQANELCNTAYSIIAANPDLSILKDAVDAAGLQGEWYTLNSCPKVEISRQAASLSNMSPSRRNASLWRQLCRLAKNHNVWIHDVPPLSCMNSFKTPIVRSLWDLDSSATSNVNCQQMLTKSTTPMTSPWCLHAQPLWMILSWWPPFLLLTMLVLSAHFAMAEAQKIPFYKIRIY